MGDFDVDTAVVTGGRKQDGSKRCLPGMRQSGLERFRMQPCRFVGRLYKHFGKSQRHSCTHANCGATTHSPAWQAVTRRERQRRLQKQRYRGSRYSNFLSFYLSSLFQIYFLISQNNFFHIIEAAWVTALALDDVFVNERQPPSITNLRRIYRLIRVQGPDILIFLRKLLRVCISLTKIYLTAAKLVGTRNYLRRASSSRLPDNASFRACGIF